LLEEGEITAELINWDGKAETPILPGEEVYLDGNDVASGHEYSDIGAVSISPR
jgi:protease II